MGKLGQDFKIVSVSAQNKRNLSQEGGREEGTESPKFQQSELLRVTKTLGSSGVCLTAEKLNEKREAL
ncbi:hypothetical protein Pyn_13328 [Prunus yedoensis var. nudiflora]|uniref:Uncharacterized protein n=1 Tax=Prunus yedoensis var. nudiflora TaxID=2094558 RepID=A0A314UV16_PRUYE|nr:hypothetical protein Pyn_13328 [Prunus yedoensis var. nudiflora]